MRRVVDKRPEYSRPSHRGLLEELKVDVMATLGDTRVHQETSKSASGLGRFAETARGRIRRLQLGLALN